MNHSTRVGEAVGWDGAENFARVAEHDARENNVNNARFLVSDAQVHTRSASLVPSKMVPLIRLVFWCGQPAHCQ